jgi:2-(1,2-epoxy-1,2-dihydrophenyl)acetyl-CoA isomerase
MSDATGDHRPDQAGDPQPASSEPVVLVSVSGGVGIITFNRPDVRNAANKEMFDGFADALRQLAGDSSVSVVVIHGAGGAFSAGGDLREPPIAGSADLQTDHLRESARTVELLAGLPQVSIAAIDGACAGAAIGWAGACTLRVVAADAIFITAYASLGRSGDFGVAWALTRLIGRGKAADWLLRPHRRSGAEAVAAGFGEALVSEGTALETAKAWALEIAALKPVARNGMLANLNDVERANDLSVYLDIESERHVFSKLAPSRDD